MLEIILFILKLIGIILLVVLGLLLLVILLVLFAPIKYKSEGSKHDDKIDVYGLITYLNPIVRVKIHYPGENIAQAKILGFTIYPAKPKKGRRTEVKDELQKETAKEEIAHEVKKEEKQDSKQESKQAEKKDSKKDVTIDTIGYYTSLFQENKTLILDVIKLVLKAFKTILPRKCYIKAVFGTGQADTTGFIYGAYCSLRESLPGEICLEPVWTESYLEGEYFVKGKIRLIHFVIAVVKVFMDKRARLLIKKLRRV